MPPDSYSLASLNHALDLVFARLERPPAADSRKACDRYPDPDFDDSLGFEPIGKAMARVVREIAP